MQPPRGASDPTAAARPGRGERCWGRRRRTTSSACLLRAGARGAREEGAAAQQGPSCRYLSFLPRHQERGGCASRDLHSRPLRCAVECRESNRPREDGRWTATAPPRRQGGEDSSSPPSPTPRFSLRALGEEPPARGASP